ncbi:MAG: cell wall hydrolase [Pseudomonadota bacterium]
MFKIIATILTWLLITAALCGPAQALPFLSFHMAFPRLVPLVPQPPKINVDGIEKYCLALAIYHEARGEPLPGQLAVAVTIVNRVRSNAYPDTVCGVVYQNSARLHRCQFSFACDRRSDMPENEGAFARAMDMAEFTNTIRTDLESNRFFGSPFAVLSDMTHYHRHDVNPVWSKKLDRLTQIGDHVFFKSDRVVGKYRTAPVPTPVRIVSAWY